jgi:hypothetical protein
MTRDTPTPTQHAIVLTARTEDWKLEVAKAKSVPPGSTTFFSAIDYQAYRASFSAFG